MKRWLFVLAAAATFAGPLTAAAQLSSGVGVGANPWGSPGNSPGMPSLGSGPSLSPEQLAAQCNSCHSSDGALHQFLVTTGESHLAPPPLADMPADQIVARAKAFRRAESQAATMHRVLKQYNDRQIREVASYMARPPAAR